MTGSSKTAQEFIQDSFSPIIGILCSQQVENVVSKNNLSFTELLQPFATFDWDGHFRDPNGSTCVVKNWKLVIRNVNWKPLPPTDARRQLNNAALHNYIDKTITLEFEGRKFDIPESTPWFDAWRETYLEVQFPSDHEFTKHFLSCIIVATTQDENIIDTFNALNQQYAQLQNVTPPKLPKWFTNGVLKSYLLLHDASFVPKDKADAMFENLKQSFGACNCFMVTINSKNSTDPNLPTDYWIQYIRRSQETTNSDAMSPSNAAVTPEQRVHQQQQKEESSIIQEGMHPLTTIENDVYDNANSLQTHVFSDSSESVNVVGKTLDYTTEQHGAALNATDIEGIKKFILEYASNALLPYIEKQIAQLSEVVANRKGVSRSLLSATKRWFGTGKSGSSTGNNTVIYTSDCPELQLRRLGDLWFLCGQWQRAFDTYHTAKREFYADSAWLCYAGALEMAALSAFMAGTATRKTHGYMEESIVTYLNTCRMVQYAVRATLLSALCLSSTSSYGEAAKQLIRMTSEDSDLRSAMLLEQAAHCFLSGPGAKAMCRKYAFHMVLSGHRFSKAGQKKHAYRCYRQAHQVYAVCGWRLATDHVQFALGRLAGALRLPREAVRWLAAPLAPAPHHLARPQSAAQQDAFLREYMLAQQQWVESCADFKECLPVVPLPLVERRATRVVCAGPAPLSSPGRTPATSLSLHPEEPPFHSASSPPVPPPRHPWHTLEQMLLQAVTGTLPMIFKPTIDLYTENTDCNPVVPQGEPMQISVTLRNPLKISLVLKEVELLWEFVSNKDNDGTCTTLNNEPAVAAGASMDNTYIVHQKLKSIIMEGDTTKPLIFTLTPMRVGHFSIKGLAYKLTNAIESENDNLKSVIISGKVELSAGVASIDKLLQIIVVPQAPCLQRRSVYTWLRRHEEGGDEALSDRPRGARGRATTEAEDAAIVASHSQDPFNPTRDTATHYRMTFSETSSEAISGEMRSVDVEFRNVGPVGMRNLYVALSHPDCVALLTGHQRNEERFQQLYQDKYSEPTQYSDERAARAGAWRSAAASSCIRVADTIESGATTRARLLMRPHATTAALRLLAYYEPDKSASAPVPLSVAPHVRAYRLLRHVFNFQVTEVVKVAVIPRRSLKTVDGVAVENLNLAVELKNISNEKEDDVVVEVLEASLLSRQWKLTNLVSAPGHADRLKAREKLHLILQARRLQDTPPDGKIEWSCQKILAEHSDSAPNIDTSPYCKFVTENKPPFIDSPEKPIQETETGKNGLIQSMFILRWKTYDKKNERTAVGQHCLWLECFEKAVSRTKDNSSPDVPTIHLDEFNSTVDSVETKTKKDNVVVFKMEHLDQIQHNFNQRKLCLIPITINIVNCYRVPVKVFIVMSKKQDGESFGGLGWAGALSHGDDIQPAECGVLVRLERFASRRVQVNAICGAPGAYVIGAAFTATAFAAYPAPLHPALPPLDPLLTHVANNTSLLVVRQAA